MTELKLLSDFETHTAITTMKDVAEVESKIRRLERHDQQARKLAFSIFTKSGADLIKLAKESDPDCALSMARLDIYLEGYLERLFSLAGMLCDARRWLRSGLAYRTDAEELLERARKEG